MTNPLDPYILGQRPIEEFPAIKWANLETNNLNARKIKEITLEVESFVHIERNKWKPCLDKAAFYTALFATAMIGTITIINLGAVIAGISSASIMTHSILCITTLVCLLTSQYFEKRHRSNELELWLNINRIFNKYPDEMSSLRAWSLSSNKYSRQLNDLATRTIQLLSQNQGTQKELVVNHLLKSRLAIQNATDILNFTNKYLIVSALRNS